MMAEDARTRAYTVWASRTEWGKVNREERVGARR